MLGCAFFMYSRLKHVFLVDYSGNLRLKFKSFKIVRDKMAQYVKTTCGRRLLRLVGLMLSVIGQLLLSQ